MITIITFFWHHSFWNDIRAQEKRRKKERASVQTYLSSLYNLFNGSSDVQIWFYHSSLHIRLDARMKFVSFRTSWLPALITQDLCVFSVQKRTVSVCVTNPKVCTNNINIKLENKKFSTAPFPPSRTTIYDFEKEQRSLILSEGGWPQRLSRF